MVKSYNTGGIGKRTAKGYNMVTASGKKVFPLHMTADDICIDDIAHSLSNICRFNGHTKRFYSVAEHSHLVASLCPPELFLCGLLHDAAEAYIGDHIRPIKALMPNIENIENDIWAVIADKFNVPAVIPEEVHHADMVALAIERRDIISHPEAIEWGDMPEIPGSMGIQAWSTGDPEIWRGAFLDEFNTYCDKQWPKVSSDGR